MHCFRVNCEVYHLGVHISLVALGYSLKVISRVDSTLAPWLVGYGMPATPPVCISRLPSNLENAYGASKAVAVGASSMLDAMSISCWLDSSQLLVNRSLAATCELQCNRSVNNKVGANS